MRTKKLTLALLMATAMAVPCLAQNETKTAETKYYHLDFVVKELEGGKATNSRNYAMMISTEHGDDSSMRTGNRVPLSTGAGQIQYLDVGVNIDCHGAREVQGNLLLNLSAEISGAASEPAGTQPVIRQNKWKSSVIVPLRKATTIFSSDDAYSKRQMQLELTATPVM